MSNNKTTNGTSRQMTLTQMNQALANKISQNVNNGSNNKSKPVSSNRKPNTATKKPQIHQIINLQQEDFLPTNSLNIYQGKNQQAFVGELAKKCGAFFNWINQVDHTILAEQLWKNKMMALVGQRFPQLNTQQQQKLIERDWKIMAPQRKQQIIRQILNQIPYEEMNKQVNEKFDQQRNQIYMQFGPKQNIMAE